MFNEYRKSVKVSNINTRFAEVIMGRINGAQLGLRENDSVSDVLERGEDFFKSRIMESESLTDNNIDKNTYDLVVKGTHGENLYVKNLTEIFTIKILLFVLRDLKNFIQGRDYLTRIIYLL